MSARPMTHEDWLDLDAWEAELEADNAVSIIDDEEES